jgi:hypothetical protein
MTAQYPLLSFYHLEQPCFPRSLSSWASLSFHINLYIYIYIYIYIYKTDKICQRMLLQAQAFITFPPFCPLFIFNFQRVWWTIEKQSKVSPRGCKMWSLKSLVMSWFGSGSQNWRELSPVIFHCSWNFFSLVNHEIIGGFKIIFF